MNVVRGKTKISTLNVPFKKTNINQQTQFKLLNRQPVGSSLSITFCRQGKGRLDSSAVAAVITTLFCFVDLSLAVAPPPSENGVALLIL